MNSGPNRTSSVFTFAVCVLLPCCGPTPARDLSNIPQRQITFDDMCHLQTYFDQRNASGAPPFPSLNEQQTETSETEPDENGRLRRAVLGEGTYVITDLFARRELSDLLQQEYRRLPPIHITAPEQTLRVHVGWWASGEMRRLRPDTSIDITTSDGATHSLPFDPCIGEFLFGGRVYAMRRNFIEAERMRARGEIPIPVESSGSSAAPDGSAAAATDAAVSDANAGADP